MAPPQCRHQWQPDHGWKAFVCQCGATCTRDEDGLILTYTYNTALARIPSKAVPK